LRLGLGLPHVDLDALLGAGPERNRGRHGVHAGRCLEERVPGGRRRDDAELWLAVAAMAVGGPEMTPVTASSESPVGKAGLAA